MVLSSNYYALKGKDWTRFWRKQRLQRCPNFQVMAILGRSPITRILKSAKGEPREIFQKSRKRMPSLKRQKSTVAQMALSSNQYALKDETLEKIQVLTAAPKVPQWPSYGNFGKVTHNPHFLKKCKGGTKGNFSKIAQGMFFKNRTKSSPRFKELRALWRKWHYPLISILLMCKNWRRFCRKRRLQNFLNGQVMAILARSPKTRIL